jgi:AraC-like DNA-binding protein
MPLIVDTSRVSPPERFRTWARILARDDEPLAARRDAELPFSVFMQRRAVGPLLLTRIRADAHVAERTRATIRASDPRLFHLMLQLQGRCSVQQDDRAAVATPGQLVAWQSSRPYAVEGLEPFESLILVCPTRLLVDGIASRTAESLEGTAGVGRLARNYVTDLFDSTLDASVGARTRSLLARSAVELIQALYADEDVPADPGRGRAQQLRHEISAFIDANLGDPALDVAAIADALPISRGYLHRLMAAEGTTVRRTVRARRLERCRRELLDPAFAGDPIARIATRWGFVSAAHFSRAYRSAYGQSPSEARRGAAEAAPAVGGQDGGPSQPLATVSLPLPSYL